MAYTLTEAERDQLKEVTRITGDILEGYGILLIKYESFFPYTDSINMSIHLKSFDNSDFLVSTRTDDSALRCCETMIKRVYPNKNYISLIGLNGRRQAKNGVPFLAKIEDLNAINEIEFHLRGKGDKRLSIDRKFSFPISIEMTSEDNLACLHFLDYTNANEGCTQIEEMCENIRLDTYISVEKGSAYIAHWHWSAYDNVQKYLSEKWQKQFEEENKIGVHFDRNPNPHYWLSEPEWEHDIVDELGHSLPDSFFLGLTFYEGVPDEYDVPLPYNTIKVVGSKHPFVFFA